MLAIGYTKNHSGRLGTKSSFYVVLISTCNLLITKALLIMMKKAVKTFKVKKMKAFSLRGLCSTC